MNKTIQRVFIITIAAICCFTAVVLSASSVFGTIAQDGYAVPSSSGISQSLSKRTGTPPISLIEVNYDDVVYKKVTGFYVGEERKQVDTAFPIYTDGGVGIRFLNEENWLLTSDVNLYQSFNGMYMSEGVSYNADMTQADDDEFIMTVLNNGLYMNAQHAVLHTRLKDVVISSNSILSLKEKALSWYAMNNGTLSYHEETALFDATITIGTHTYNYLDLLDAMGLIRKALQNGGRPDDALTEEAGRILIPPNNLETPNRTNNTPYDSDDTTRHDTVDPDNESNQSSTKPSDNAHTGGTVTPGKDDQDPVAGKPDDTPSENHQDNKGSYPDTITVSARKVLNRPGYKVPDGAFHFTLEEITDGGAEIRQAVANEGENITFEPIKYTQAGQYRYRLREILNEDANYNYDPSVFEILVTVTEKISETAASDESDNNDDAKVYFVPEAQYYKNGTECLQSEVTFYNTSKDYDPGQNGNPDIVRRDSVKLEIAASVYLNNGLDIPQDGEFIALLQEETESGVHSRQVVDNVSTDYWFDTLIFEKTGTYTFYVSQIQDAKNTSVIYDDTVYTVIVQVVQDENGELTLVHTLYKGTTPLGSDLNQMHFYNRYRTAEDPVPDDGSDLTPVEVTLSAFKHVQDSDQVPTGRFSFSLEYTGSTSEAYSRRKSNVGGTVTFDPVVLDREGVYVYEMHEIQNDSDEEYIYDTARFTAVIKVSFDETSLKLTPEIEYFKNGLACNPEDVGFVNRSKADGSSGNTDSDKSVVNIELDVRKILDNSPYKYVESDRFQFILESVEEIGVIPRQYKTNKNGNVTFDPLSFKSSGRYTYQVREIINAGDTKYQYDTSVYTVVINVTESRDNSGKPVYSAVTGYYKNGEAYDSTRLVFNNTTVGAEPETPAVWDSVEVTFAGRKVIDGDTGKSVPDGRFHYLLNQRENGILIPRQCVANQGSQFTFEPVTFTEPGEYSYTIQEVVQDGDQQFQYDTTSYVALVTVTGDEETHTLSRKVEYFKDGVTCNANDVEFNNLSQKSDDQQKENDPMDVEHVRIAAKVLLDDPGHEILASSDSPLAAGMFQFVLEKYVDGRAIPQQYVSNKAGTGKGCAIEFRDIPMTEPGTYTYQIRQLPAVEHDNIDIDDSAISAIVTVRRKADGSDGLEAVVEYRKAGVVCTPEKAQFMNKVKEVQAAELIASAKVLLDNGDKMPKHGQFQFVMKQLVDNAENPVQYKTNVGQTVSFDGIRFTQSGKYSYQLQQIGSVEGITLDPSVFTIQVNVEEDDITGELTLETVYMKNGKRCTAAAVMFENVTEDGYVEEPTARVRLSARITVDDSATKHVDSHTFQVNLAEVSDGRQYIVQKQENESHNVLFDALEFTAPGDYVYTLSQQTEGEVGMYFLDESVYKALIHVAQDAEGNLIPTVTYFRNDSATAVSAENVVFDNITNTGYVKEENNTASAIAYRAPWVSLSNFKTWSYAISTDITVSDRSNAIQRGAKISVYSDLKPAPNAADAQIEDGMKVYPASKYEGKGGLLRKTRYDTETFPLSILEPGSTVYVQVNYKYATEPEAVLDENGNVQMDPDSGTPKQYGGEYYKDEFDEFVYDVSGNKVIDPSTTSYQQDPNGTRIASLNGRSILAVDGSVIPAEQLVRDEKTGWIVRRITTVDENRRPNTETEEIRVEVEPGTREPLMKQNKANYYSDFIEVTLPSLEEGNIQPVRANWNTGFAASSTGINFTKISLNNTSDYNEELAKEEFEFENFKLDTLPYASRIDVTLTPVSGGKSVVIPIYSSVLQRAMGGSLADFISNSPPLEPNTAYTYTVTLKDRYGNDMPLVIGSEDSVVSAEDFSETIYTSKTTPTVRIDTVENITDKLTVKVTVSDPDGALNGQPLRFNMRANALNSNSELDGQWDRTKIRWADESKTVLELLEPGDGDSYQMMLDSLAFSRLFTAEVYGSYSPQPDQAPADSPQLPAQTNVSMGQSQIYTAALTRGEVNFNSQFSNLRDSSLTINLLMQNSSDLEVLDYIDEYRITLRDGDGNVKVNTVLKADELMREDAYTYDAENKLIVTDAGNDIRPRIEFYGEASRHRGSPWESMNVRLLSAGTEEEPPEYTNPMQVRVSLPAGTLDHNTTYFLDVKAVVIKSGEEYDSIAVNLTNKRITTKKTIPLILYDDLFIAAEIAEFQNLRIYDPDHTIDNGNVTINLYQGNTLLAVQPIKVTYDPAAPGINYTGGTAVRFRNLIKDAEYRLEFVAPGYNDEEGYGAWKSNYVLERDDIIGGSELTGSLEMVELSDASAGVNAKIRVLVNDRKGYLGRPGESCSVTLEVWQSDSVQIPEYEHIVELDQVLPLNKNANGTLELDMQTLLENLEYADSFKITMKAPYHGELFELCDLVFTADPNFKAVGTHAELIAAMNANKKANIVVTKDFIQDQNTCVSGFQGTIDFQGHAVTRGSNITTYFLNLNDRNATVRNLVYDYPTSAYYKNPAAMVNDLSGTLENVIVRTHGQVEIEKNTQSLLAYSASATGSLTNFILQLNGDVTVNNETSSQVGVLVSSTYARMENGYIYGKNSAGLIGTGLGYGALIGYNRQSTIVSHVYVIMDSWMRDNTSNVLLRAFAHGTVGYSNIYTVGDQYAIEANSVKGYGNPLSKLKITNNETSGFTDLWALTSRNYDGVLDSVTKMGPLSMLYDVDWQQQMMGSGFDVAGTVPLGFYPRLNLPMEMQKYQEYLALPVLSAERVPKILKDGWSTAKGYDTHGLDEGYITLRFQMDTAGCTIDDVKIAGLKSEVVHTENVGTSFCDVTLKVLVDPENPSYMSTYKVTSFTYTTGTTAREVEADYTTSDIEFWKSVSTPQEWAAINNNMKWNYKLVNDIDCSLLSRYQTVLDGNTGKNGTTTFSGKLDGQEHVVSGIKLGENLTNYTDRPSVIYQLAAGSQLKNLFVDGMQIYAGRTSDGYTGFIRYGNATAVIDNVRIKGATIYGTGVVGGLIGYGNAVISNCSVVDTTIIDVESGRTNQIGGFAGGTYTSVVSCYTRDVTIIAENANVVSCVGGFTGIAGGGGSLIEDCYAHGTITINGSNVGGFYGNSPTGDGRQIRRCISYVNILQRSGNYTGGFSGSNAVTGGIYVVLGNVSAPGTAVNRASGSGTLSNVFVYDGQDVTGKAEGEKGNATYLVSGAQLGRRDYWMDTIRLGTAWSYNSVRDHKSLPLLAQDTTRSGWSQSYIPLPGMGTDPALKIAKAEYHSNEDTYELAAQLSHPGIASADIVQMYKNKELTLNLDGLDISDAACQGEKPITVIKVEADPEVENQTDIVITVKGQRGMLKALDSYEMVVSYTDPLNSRDRKLTTMVQYMQDGKPKINYWEIRSLQDWNDKVEPRKYNSENFMILGWVDFLGQNTLLNGLRINRLEGADKETCGFRNLNYDGFGKGLPWIEKLSMNLSNLTFENVTAKFNTATETRTGTGMIYSLAEADNLVFKNIDLQLNRYTRANFGFISDMDGALTNVEMTDITVRDTDNGGSNTSYMSALVGVSRGTMDKIKVNNILMSVPKSSYVGTVLGYKGNGGMIRGIEVTGLNVAGYNNVGGVAGASTNSPYNVKVIGVAEGGMNKVTASNSGASGVNASGYSSGSGTMEVRNMEITSDKGWASGVFNYYHSYATAVIVDNCKITGSTFVAGVVAGSKTGGSITLSNVEITNCVITNTNTTANASYETTATGGVIGGTSNLSVNKATVRNTQINGNCNVGGIAGSLVNDSPITIKINRAYVAEDVTINARGSRVGGLVGNTNRVIIENSAMGASVTANGDAAGGLVGQMELVDGKIASKLSQNYVRGSVYAKGDYAAGLVGKLNSKTEQFTDTEMTKNIVASDIRTGGHNISSWALNTGGGEAGRVHVYICEDTLLNGSTAKDIKDLAASQGKTSIAQPNLLDNTNLLVPSARFAEESLYQTTLSFSKNYWNYTGLSSGFMPWTTGVDSANGAPLNSTSLGKTVGIPLPEPGAEGTPLVAYASGINTLNLEGGTPGASETVNGTTVGTYDENGVMTLFYDYKNSITVGGTTYQPAKLQRLVMVWGGWWYYVDSSGTLHYGNAVSNLDQFDGGIEYKEGENSTLTLNGRVVHLWGGKALTDAGTIYDLAGPEATAAGSAGTSLTPAEQSVPFCTNGSVQLYYYFSQVGQTKLNYQVYTLNDWSFTVSRQQNVVYDGVMMTSLVLGGQTTEFMGMLKESGVIEQHLSGLNLSGDRNADIAYMSNSMGYDGGILLLRYRNGSVYGFDVTTGDEILTYTDPSAASFASYALKSIRRLFTGLTSSPAPTSNGLSQSKQNQQSLEDELKQLLTSNVSVGDPTNGTILSDGTALGNGEGMGAGTAGITGGGTLLSGGNGLGGGSAVGNGTGHGNGNGSDSGGAANGSAAGSTDGSKYFTVGQKPAGHAAADEKDEELTLGILSGEQGELSGQLGDLSGELGEYPDEEDDGNAEEAASDGESASGTYGGSGSGDSGVAAQSDEEVLEELFGASVLMFNPATGDYGVMTTSSVASGEPEEISEAIEKLKEEKTEAEEAEEEETETEAEAQEKGFSIRNTFTRSLNSSDRYGFAMVAGMSALSIIILAVIYFVVIRKKKH